MIETKEIILYGTPNGDADQRKRYNEIQSYIQDLTSFGWQQTQVTTRRPGRVTYNIQILARDTTIPHYDDYFKLENDYEKAKKTIKPNKPFDLLIFLILLFLFIFPAVLYVVLKIMQNAKINENNQLCDIKMKEAVSSAKNIK